MDILYAPWRGKYVTKTARKKPIAIESKDCIFCAQFEKNEDEKYYIFKRYKYNVVMLNLHPYNAGHLMILPIDHIANMYDLEKNAANEMMALTSHSSKILTDILKCQGINIGMNLGKTAGAGLPGHLHMHVLPRWDGDTNWLPLLAQTKQVSVDLNHIYKELKPAFKKLVF